MIHYCKITFSQSLIYASLSLLMAGLITAGLSIQLKISLFVLFRHRKILEMPVAFDGFCF